MFKNFSYIRNLSKETTVTSHIAKMIMNHQNVWVWKEVAVTSFMTLSLFLCRDWVKL